jgi:uncharacterized protein YbjT (DUF2867 family)
LFTALAAWSIADEGTLRLPFGGGRTSPIAAVDIARVVATILEDPRHAALARASALTPR